ncbi:MAG TPA: SPOR domain-containing protein [Candidatus Acidoferrales bacterium]|nr:SPOR domain-containing protein [Candidatus Acidoferrales bacterium]
MGNGSKRGGGDRVLESRHLVGLFLGVVLLCCVFFTLGYVMGRTQYGNTAVQAAPVERPSPLSSRTSQSAAAQPPSSPEWDFYTNKKTTDIPLKPAPASSSRPIESIAPSRTAGHEPAAPVVAARNASATPGRFRPPTIPRGAIVLQVGALKSESDALALADALQKKGFPAFVLAPASDNFYRVQVGPFSTQAIGDKAKQSLEREGFRAIFKR